MGNANAAIALWSGSGRSAFERLWSLPATVKGVEHPFPVSDSKYRDAHPDVRVRARIDTAPVRMVTLARLVAIQKSVNPSRVEHYIENPELPEGTAHWSTGAWLVDFPIVIVHDGVFYLHDGHHRATAAYVRGEWQIRARVIDFDAETVRDHERESGVRIAISVSPGGDGASRSDAVASDDEPAPLGVPEEDELVFGQDRGPVPILLCGGRRR
jgi:hypothetical protein